MNIKEVKSAMNLILNHSRLVPLLMGAHGKGKSEVVKQYCTENGLEMIDLRLSTLEVGDFLGLPEFTRDKEGNVVATHFAKPDWFPTKGKGIVFLDEINRAKKDMLQAAFQLALDKQIHTHKLPPGWNVVAACNPNTGDYITTDMSDAAFVDRFAYVKFEPTVTEWLSHARTVGASQDLLDFVGDMPQHLEMKGEDFNLDFVKPSRRSMMELDGIHRAGCERDLFRQIAFGVIGPETTLAYLNHMDNNKLSLTAKEVMKLSKATKTAKETEAKIKRIVEKNRIDILNRAVDELLTIEDEPSADEVVSLRKFILMLPKEVAFKLVDGIGRHDSTLQPIFEDDEVCKYFEDSTVDFKALQEKHENEAKAEVKEG